MRIVYLCHLSNAMVRSHLHLKTYRMRDLVLSLMGRHSKTEYADFAIWNTDMATEFEKLQEHEFHIVAPHIGMKKDIEHFVANGVNYHFYKCNGSLVKDVIYSKLHLDRRFHYRRFRSKIKTIIEGIHPDIVVVCGAEQPYFSSGIFDIKSCPIYVLLQTVVSNPQLKGYLKGGDEMAAMEEAVYRKINYVGTGRKYLQLFRQYNSEAFCLPFSFPSHQPLMVNDVNKIYDFVFFASVITKNKGVEDVILAYNQVFAKHPAVTLNICGRLTADYQSHLEGLIDSNAMANQKVVFTGYFPSIDEKYKHIQKSRIVVVPGISAALNSTVRESMLMSLPTVVYETPSTIKINAESQAVISAKMENVDDLADKMEYLLCHPDIAQQIASQGKKYADKTWDNSVVVKRMMDNIEAIMQHYYNQQPIPKELLLEEES